MEPGTFCDPSFCPTAYAGLLVVGVILAAFAAWFFLHTQVAARWFGTLMAWGRLRAVR